MRFAGMLLAVMLFDPSGAFGQQAPLPNRRTLTLEAARRVAAAAEAEARKNNWAVSIAVLDDAGHLVVIQRMDGRDHNANGFSVWLAGGGVKGGTVVGATDQYGYKAVENPKSVYELHATILHLLGLDHEELTYRFNGRDMRLTDVHGNVIKEIVA